MDYFHRNITVKSILLFFFILLFISIVAFKLALPFIWVFFAIFTVLLFFTQSTKLSIKWLSLPDEQFQKRTFLTALIIRISWVVFSYFFYIKMNEHPFEFASADALGYHNEAEWMLKLLKNGNWDKFQDYYATRRTDMGYPVYLILIYSVFGKSIFVARLIKALLGAFTVILIYKIANRNFGEKTARLVAIFAMLYPNLIYYTGLHVKETEMVFMLVAFTERADFLLRQRKFIVGQFILLLFLGVSLYFFRAVLAYSVLASLILTLIFSREEIYHLKKSILIVLSIIFVVLFFYGNNYFTEALEYWSSRFSNQEVSLLHRTQTNALAKYGSAFVFAPFSLIAPFPTFVNIETQQNHMLLSGVFYVKNILAFFVILALIHLFTTNKWKNHVLLLALMISYISILTMSKFALVERFHLPALPYHIMFTAYGISIIKTKQMKYFSYYLVLIAVVIIGWNWIKLAGRALI